jgi:hypothetical protein
VVYTCHPKLHERLRCEGLQFKASLGEGRKREEGWKGLQETSISKKKSWVWLFMPDIPATARNIK